MARKPLVVLALALIVLAAVLALPAPAEATRGPEGVEAPGPSGLYQRFAQPFPAPPPEAGEPEFDIWAGVPPPLLATATATGPVTAESFHPLSGLELPELEISSAFAAADPKTHIGVFEVLGGTCIGVWSFENADLRWGFVGSGPGSAVGLFQGAWTDPTTGIAYHRARWYDPRTQSWLSEDPEGDVDSPNLYAFVGWGPNSFSDPLGLKKPVYLPKSGLIQYEDDKTGEIQYWNSQGYKSGSDLYGAVTTHMGGTAEEATRIVSAAGMGADLGIEKSLDLAQGVNFYSAALTEYALTRPADIVSLGVMDKLLQQAGESGDVSGWQATQDAAYDLMPYEDVRELVQEGDSMSDAEKARNYILIPTKTAGVMLLGLAPVAPASQELRGLQFELPPRPAPVPAPHGNSLASQRVTHVYRIDGPKGLQKIGESGQGTRVSDGASVRAESQVRKLQRKTGDVYSSRILKTFSNKADARKYETALIKRYTSRFSRPPGNPLNR